MRWRLIDNISALTPWVSICGRKAVTFEEYSLQKPFGRKGEFPESLIVGSCVELARWLVMASSDWQQGCQLVAVNNFRFTGIAGRGDTFALTLTVTARTDSQLTVACRATVDGHALADGQLVMQLTQLAEYDSAERRQLLWRELYAAA